MELFELVKKLIGIPSPTGSEWQVLDFLREYLDQIGMEVSTQEVSKDRYNIVAAVGTPRVVLSTHTDTVEPYVPYSHDDDYIYGRGACDSKGILAAMIKAAEALQGQGATDFGLLFLVGEEGESDGARAANRLDNHCRYLINGEPTENKQAVGSKGTLRLKITTRGKACHSAYPDLGESAVEKMLDVLQDIRAMALPTDDLLGETTCNIGLIQGGILPNVVPDFAEAVLMFRVVDSTRSIEELVRRVVADRAQLDFYFGYEPIRTHTVLGFPTMVAAYGTDIPFLSNWGTPLLFGPGSIIDAHTTGEKIAKEQLTEAVGHYVTLVRHLL